MNSYMATGKHLLILGGCVPSINPQQWANEAPLFDIAETKVSKLAWDSQRWSKSLKKDEHGFHISYSKLRWIYMIVRIQDD